MIAGDRAARAISLRAPLTPDRQRVTASMPPAIARPLVVLLHGRPSPWTANA